MREHSSVSLSGSGKKPGSSAIASRLAETTHFMDKEQAFNIIYREKGWRSQNDFIDWNSFANSTIKGNFIVISGDRMVRQAELQTLMFRFHSAYYKAAVCSVVKKILQRRHGSSANQSRKRRNIDGVSLEKCWLTSQRRDSARFQLTVGYSQDEHGTYTTPTEAPEEEVNITYLETSQTRDSAGVQKNRILYAPKEEVAHVQHIQLEEIINERFSWDLAECSVKIRLLCNLGHLNGKFLLGSFTDFVHLCSSKGAGTISLGMRVGWLIGSNATWISVLLDPGDVADNCTPPREISADLRPLSKRLQVLPPLFYSHWDAWRFPPPRPPVAVADQNTVPLVEA
ncbi:hypothetical protein T265_15167, partial [Opisthorchis viverrini]